MSKLPESTTAKFNENAAIAEPQKEYLACMGPESIAYLSQYMALSSYGEVTLQASDIQFDISAESMFDPAEISALLSHRLADFVERPDAKQIFRQQPLLSRKRYLRALAHADVDTSQFEQRLAADVYALGYLDLLSSLELEFRSINLRRDPEQVLVAHNQNSPWFGRVLSEMETLGKVNNFQKHVLQRLVAVDGDRDHLDWGKTKRSNSRQSMKVLRRNLHLYANGFGLHKPLNTPEPLIELSKAEELISMLRLIPVAGALAVLSTLHGANFPEHRFFVGDAASPKYADVRVGVYGLTCIHQALKGGLPDSNITSIQLAYVTHGEDYFLDAVERIAPKSCREAALSAVYDRPMWSANTNTSALSDHKGLLSRAANKLHIALEDPELRMKELNNNREKLTRMIERLHPQDIDYLVGEPPDFGALPRPSRVIVERELASTAEERQQVIRDENARRRIDRYRNPVTKAGIPTMEERALYHLERYFLSPTSPMTYTPQEISHEMRARYNMLTRDEQQRFIADCIPHPLQRELFLDWVKNEYSHDELAILHNIMLDCSIHCGDEDTAEEEVQIHDDPNRLVGYHLERVLRRNNVRVFLLGSDHAEKYITA